MGNPALERLRKNDKKGLFLSSQTSVSYLTGLTPLDYKNGYIVEVRDRNEKLIKKYESLGVVGGTFITIVGKTGTAKTTLASQIAAKIVKDYPCSFCQHFDLEQADSYTRIKKVTGLSQAELEDKYVLRQEKMYIENIFEAIMLMAKDKEENKEEWQYETGLDDEFGHPIVAYQPTVVILDSIPTVASEDSDGKTAMEGSTYANRVAKALAQFYKKLMPIIKTYNITVIAINHINAKIEINPFAKTQPQILTLKMDESIPGGNAPLYYANNIFKLTSIGSEKFTLEDDGFDGFVSRCDLLKARTNKSGQFCELVYNQVTGFDPLLTQFRFAMQNGMVAGRNPYRYFNEFPDVKFDSRKFTQLFAENEEIRKGLFASTIPIMQKQLREGSAPTNKMAEYLAAVQSLLISQENEEFEETVSDAKVSGSWGNWNNYEWETYDADYYNIFQ